MQKNYDHIDLEDQLYQEWEASGVMRADATSDKPSFTIALPPPNVTGELHLGHAAMLAIEDIVIRFKKMTGHEVLWIPGTDHAAIATENVVIKHLGLKSREELSREDFLQKCWEFSADKHDRIVEQMKKMGAHLDWSREIYTFDEQRNHAVNAMFKQLYDDGLIVRGHRMINWSVGAQSVLSDDEVEWGEHREPFYSIRCGEFIIGTVRSETKCADSPVVVHPDGTYVRAEFTDPSGAQETFIISENLYKDEKRRAKVLNLLDPEGTWNVLESMKGAELEGQTFEYETYAGKRKFYVLADAEAIDMDKGTGSMTISASHSAEDYDLAKRRGLDETFIEKIDFAGKMTAICGPCEGMEVKKARKESAKIMKAQGLLVGEETDYVHRVPLCYRSGCVVEPMISPQWFVSVEKEFVDRHTGKKTTLKKLTANAVREKNVKVIPERFEKTYFHWIDNLRDWCISRQIWWGHRIPVWYDKKGSIHLPKEQKIHFVRHGESEGNATGIASGQIDHPLTKKGRDQARKTAENLQNKTFSKIICSDLSRAKETAEIIAKEIGFSGNIECWPELREIHYGDKEGQTPPDKPCMEWAIESGTGETTEELQTRAQEVWEKLKNQNIDGEILVVGHRSFSSVLFAVHNNKTPDQFVEYRKQWTMSNGEVKTVSQFLPPEGKNLKQDEDTLDTWFSSALWPMSPLGWPESGESDFEKFYPTDVLETGHDILFFWVARMLMFGRYATGQYPFHTVYLHGLVCDEKGQKMSKSKGNGINPLDVIKESGADAVRLSLVIGTTPGNNIPLGKGKISGYRNFVNKLWNAGRFVQMQMDNAEMAHGDLKPKSLADKWIFGVFAKTCKKVENHLQKYEISAAGDTIYHFVWDEFCDWYIEASKAEPNPAFLKSLFGEILKLTHPLCPFVTEALWKDLFAEESLLIEGAYPNIDFSDPEAESMFETIQNIVTEIRKLRADHNLNPKEKFEVFIEAENDAAAFEEGQGLIEQLAGLSKVHIAQHIEQPEGSVHFVVNGLNIFAELPFDQAAEDERRGKLAESLKQEIKNLTGRLENKNYVDKAPPHLVEQTRKALEDAEAKLRSLE